MHATYRLTQARAVHSVLKLIAEYEGGATKVVHCLIPFTSRFRIRSISKKRRRRGLNDRAKNLEDTQNFMHKAKGSESLRV